MTARYFIRANIHGRWITLSNGPYASHAQACATAQTIQRQHQLDHITVIRAETTLPHFIQ